jgi:hypothetical protein
MKYSIDFILRYAEGRLDEADRSMLERDAAADPAVQAAIDEIALTRRGLQASRADSFKPFFSERVLQEAPSCRKSGSLALSLASVGLRARRRRGSHRRDRTRRAQRGRIRRAGRRGIVR